MMEDILQLNLLKWYIERTIMHYNARRLATMA